MSQRLLGGLAALCLFSLGAGCSGAANQEKDGATQAQATGEAPAWKMATLILRRTDVDYVDAKGIARHLTMRMPSNEEATVAAEARSVPGLLSTWSGGLGSATMRVIPVDTPVTSVSRIGDPSDGYWIAPNDIASILTTYIGSKTYDSVFVIWNPGNATQAVPACCYWGMGPSEDSHGATFAALHPSANGEAMMHEWLHGAGGFYRDVRHLDVPDPHDAALYGFTDPSAEGSWSDWYTGLLSGRITKDGKPHGYTPEVWQSGTPTAAATMAATSAPATNAPRDAARPRVRRASVDGDWVYVEWDPVMGATEYTQFVIVKKADGSFGEVVSLVGPGADDRGDFRYSYFHKSELCAAVQRTGAAANPVALLAQVWSGSDASTAETRDVDGSLICL